MTAGAEAVAASARRRAKHAARPRRPLSARELKAVFARIKKRILKGGVAFGVFAMKHGTGRQFKLLSITDPNYQAQLRVDKALEHCVATYDASADLGDVWDDLYAFDRSPAA